MVSKTKRFASINNSLLWMGVALSSFKVVAILPRLNIEHNDVGWNGGQLTRVRFGLDTFTWHAYIQGYLSVDCQSSSRRTCRFCRIPHSTLALEAFCIEHSGTHKHPRIAKKSFHRFSSSVSARSIQLRWRCELRMTMHNMSDPISYTSLNLEVG